MIFTASTNEALLGAFPVIYSDESQKAAEELQSKLDAKIIKLYEHEGQSGVVGNHYAAAALNVWFCSYQTPMHVTFPDSNCVRLQLWKKGLITTTLGKKPIAVNAQQGCVAAAGMDVQFGPGAQQVVLRIRHDLLVKNLADLAGRPITRKLEFAHDLDFTTMPGQYLRNLMKSFVTHLDQQNESPPALFLAEMERSLISAFLFANRHSYYDVLHAEPINAASCKIRHAEEYMESNWAEPMAIQDITATLGISARSLYRGFQQRRSCSPMTFLKKIRLQHAHQLLNSGDSSLSITEIAHSCGFSDASHFTKNYRQAFGEVPSQTAMRKRV